MELYDWPITGAEQLSCIECRTPKKGGATVFPVSRNTKEGLKKIQRDGEKWNRGPRGWYCNDPAVFKIAPNPGDAVLFW